MKKIISLILCICMVFCAIPVFSISAEEKANLVYTFANDLPANADGVIRYYDDSLGSDFVKYITLYWADDFGAPLDGYLPIAEIDYETFLSGYAITGNKLIPKGATKLLAEFTTEGLSLAETVDIPVDKKNNDRDDAFSMFFISDTHINHAMNSTSNANYSVMGKSAMVQRFDMMKNLMDNLTAQGDNVVGVSVIGDVVQGASIGDNMWLADDYDYEYAQDVLSSSVIEGAYPMWYTNGNHDITNGVNGDNSAWMSFFENKIDLVNTAITEKTYAQNILDAVEPIQKESGKYWYDTYIAGYHFIYISAPYNGFQVGEEQLKWLEAELKADADSGKTTFVLGHFQTKGTVSVVTNGGKCHMDDSVAFQEILNKYPNVIYLSGHTHANFLYDPVCLLMGDNTPTYVNTGCFHRVEQPETVYISEGVYCRVYDDSIEFEARHFYNYTDSTDGYWIPSASYVLNLKESTDNINAKVVSSSNDIITGTNLTATVDGKVADTAKYDVKWYIGNTLVSNSANYTVSAFCGENGDIPVPSGTVSVKITDKTDAGKYAWAFADSTSETCIPIHTAQELAKIGVDENYPLDGKYALMNDIDLSNYGNWTPIGKMSIGTDGFKGLFDGNNHTIKGLTINLSAATDGATRLSAGLFAHTEGAEIRNLIIKDANVSAGFDGYVFIGAIAGDIETDTNGNPTIFSNVAVIDSSIKVTQLSNKNVCGAGAFAGATDIIAQSRNGAKFIDCYSNADIIAQFNGKQSCAGGFLGYAYETKTPCQITGSIFDGTITGHTAGATRIGGFFGKATLDNTVIANSYSNSDKYTEKAAETAIYPVSGTMISTSELTAATVANLKLSDKWIDSDIGPVLKIAEYDLLYADYIKISTGTELAKIGVDANYPLDGKYILTNDIDLSSFKNWTPIGDTKNVYEASATPAHSVFSGTLDGNGYTIKNLTIDWTTGFPETNASGKIIYQVYVGLFSATRGATVKNIVFDNANVSVTNPINQNFAGVVAGSAETLDSTPSCYTNIHIKNSTVAIIKNTGSASGAGSFVGTTNKRTTSVAGGLVLTDCYSDADITNKSTNGQSTCGGFVGYAYGTNSNGIKFSNSIFAGTLTTSKWKGAVIGRCNDSAVTRVITNVYTTAGIENTATDGTNISVGSNGDYDSTADLETLKFTDKYWYNTPVGARHRLTLVNGDVDANGAFEAADAVYIRKYLLGIKTKIDSAAADANSDGTNDILDLIRIKKAIAGI